MKIFIIAAAEDDIEEQEEEEEEKEEQNELHSDAAAMALSVPMDLDAGPAAAPARSSSVTNEHMITFLNNYIAEYGVTSRYAWNREQKRAFEGALFAAAIPGSWAPKDSIEWIKSSFRE
jgi:hypothetical protein